MRWNSTQSKDSIGPILLTCSFPYVSDWLNKNSFRNEPNARLICNLQNGSPITPDSLWTVIRQLRKRTICLIENGSYKWRKKGKIKIYHKDKEMESILHTPFCNYLWFRYIPEYALKMRWPMNSKQGNIITKEISPLQKVSDHNYF